MTTGKRVIIANVRHGSAARGRGGTLYAELLDADSRELMICATLDYILAAITERGYHVISKGYNTSLKFHQHD